MLAQSSPLSQTFPESIISTASCPGIDHQPGVISSSVGFADGVERNPTFVERMQMCGVDRQEVASHSFARSLHHNLCHVHTPLLYLTSAIPYYLSCVACSSRLSWISAPVQLVPLHPFPCPEHRIHLLPSSPNSANYTVFDFAPGQHLCGT